MLLKYRSNSPLVLLVFVSSLLGLLSGGAKPLCETWSQQETGATMFRFRGQGKGLAVAVILAGLTAPASAGDERAVYASLGETTRSPIGWVEFCAENPGQFPGRAAPPGGN